MTEVRDCLFMRPTQAELGPQDELRSSSLLHLYEYRVRPERLRDHGVFTFIITACQLRRRWHKPQSEL